MRLAHTAVALFKSIPGMLAVVGILRVLCSGLPASLVLLTAFAGKAFLDAPYSQGTTKLDYYEVLDAVQWLDAHFHLIRPPRDEMPSIEYILDRARAAVLRCGLMSSAGVECTCVCVLCMLA